MRRELVLTPFSNHEMPQISVSGFLVRDQDRLTIVYCLSGALQSLSIPEPSTQPQRKTGLWEETCFELFMAPAGLGSYWEFNFSPAGHWNVYYFDGYRLGMREEAAWQSLPFTVELQDSGLRLLVELDLSRVAVQGQRFDVGVSAVVRQSTGGPSYWALCHRGPVADFHRRDGFIVSL